MTTTELDNAAANYFTDKGQIEERFITKSTLRLALPYINNKSILQLGLGNGFIAKQIDPVVARQVVVEGSAKLVTEFNSELKNSTIMHGFFEDFCLDEEFDVVLANHVLEHVDEPVNVLTHLKKFLKPQGKIIITVPNAQSLHRRIGVDLKMLNTIYQLNDTDRAVGHKRVYDTLLMQQHINDAGYLIIEQSGYLLKLVSLKQMEGSPDNLLDSIYNVSRSIPMEFCSNLFFIIQAK